MRETRGASGAGEIGRLREHVLALADADRVRPEDEQALLTALDAALAELSMGDMPAVRAGIERFIAAAQGLFAAGMLEERDGLSPLAAARALLATLEG